MDLRAKASKKPHATLGVGVNATPAEIKRAYRTACLQHHPDKQANASDDSRTRSRHLFARIQTAYEKLTAAPTRNHSSSFNAAERASGYGDDDDDDEDYFAGTHFRPSTSGWGGAAPSAHEYGYE